MKSNEKDRSEEGRIQYCGTKPRAVRMRTSNGQDGHEKFYGDFLHSFSLLCALHSDSVSVLSCLLIYFRGSQLILLFIPFLVLPFVHNVILSVHPLMLECPFHCIYILASALVRSF